jgi:hypothetical protein
MSGASLNLNVAGNVNSHSSGESTDIARSRSPSPLRSSGVIVNDLAPHVDVVVIDMEQLFGMLEPGNESSTEEAWSSDHAVAPGPAPVGATPVAAVALAPAVAPAVVPPAPAPVVAAPVAPVAAPVGGAPGPAPAGVPPAAAGAGGAPGAAGAAPAPVGGGGARALCARFLNDLFLGPPNCGRATVGWAIIVGGSIPFGMSVAVIAGVPGIRGSASDIAGTMAFGNTLLLLGAVLLGLQYCRPAPRPPAAPPIPQSR